MSCSVSNNVYFVYGCHTSNNRNAIACSFLFNRYSIYERLKCPPPSHSSAASLIRCGCWHVIQRCNQSTWPTKLCFVHFRGGRQYIIDFTLYNIMSCLQNRRLVIQSRFYHVCFIRIAEDFFVVMRCWSVELSPISVNQAELRGLVALTDLNLASSGQWRAVTLEARYDSRKVKNWNITVIR